MDKQTKRFRPFCLPTAQGFRIGKPMNEEPHIGKLIKAALVEQGRSITWLAKQLGCSRQNAYKILNRKWIYTDLLLKICDILDYDFFKCFSEWREQRNKTITK
jgi:DNA-binding Xre family transcriptional regulator